MVFFRSIFYELGNRIEAKHNRAIKRRGGQLCGKVDDDNFSTFKYSGKLLIIERVKN